MAFLRATIPASHPSAQILGEERMGAGVAVTPDQVNQAARAQVKPDELTIVVVGDPAKVGDLARYGKVRVVKDVTAFE